MRRGPPRIDALSRIAVTLTADRIFGTSLTLNQCVDVLRQLELGSVVHRIILLIHINDRVFMDPDVEADIRQRHLQAFMRFMFDEGHMRPAVAEMIEAGRNFRPLSDQALLATLELALQVCPRNGGRSVEETANRVQLAHIVLSFQAELFSPVLTSRMTALGDMGKLGEEDWAEFVRNRIAHSTRSYYRHAMGRLFAFCCKPEIGDVVFKKMRLTLEQWFLDHIGVSPRAYVGVAFMLVTPALRLNLDQPKSQDLLFDPQRFFACVCEPQQSHIQSLLRLSTCSIQDFGPDDSLQLSLSKYLYRATRFFVTPVLNMGNASICVSPTLLLNKFLTGLPYLAQQSKEVRLGRRLTNSEVKAARAPFGHLFESYVIWLFHQWLRDWPRTQIISSYYCRANKTEKSERDLLIIRRDAAFAIEIKSSPAVLKLRQTGGFEQIDSMLKQGASQVKEAANSLVQSEAVRSDGTPIQGVRRVIPCVLTFDSMPLFPPLSEFYEQHMERELGVGLFSEGDGIYPVQWFDIGFLEAWEFKFDLSPESGSPFGYLEIRARDARLRHMGIQDSMVASGPRPESPHPFNDLVDAAFELVNTEARSWMRSSA